MTRITCVLDFLSAVATVSLLVLASAPALADQENERLEEIIVQAPISVKREVTRSAAAPTVTTEEVELKRQVYIGDLDLSLYADVKELESRIEQVAEDSCKKLSDMFPLRKADRADARRCVDRAIKSAMAEKEAAIAAAQ